MGRGVTELFLHPAKSFRTIQKPSPMRSKRAAVNHVQGISQLAEPSVENTEINAFPTRFSSGTKPMPATSTVGKRLSALRSRLSPIMNRFQYGKRSDEHTSELHSLMRISSAIIC